MIEPRIVTEPLSEPITLVEVRQHLNLDTTLWDSKIELYIGAARRYIEWRAARTFHQAELLWTLDAWPGCGYIVLPRATPLISITSLKYIDENAVETTWGASNYIADTFSEPGRAVLPPSGSWPTAALYSVAPIRIQYFAGIATTSPITEAGDDVKLPMLLLVGGFLENAESEVLSDRTAIQAISFQYGAEAFIEKLIAERRY